MVILESACAAAFAAGAVACMFKLFLWLPQSPNSVNSSTGNDPFVESLFVTCLMGVFALWTQKGSHACWRPASFSRSGSGTTCTSRSTSSNHVTSALASGECSARRGSEGDGLIAEASPTVISDTDRNEPMSDPKVAEDALKHDSSEERDLSCADEMSEDVRLERQSSFVVSV